jgi:hypothetical protein
MNAQSEVTPGYYQMNIPGIIAGTALIVLPFLGAWWSFSVGNGAVTIAFSPFLVLVKGLGTEITSPLFASLTLGLTFIFIYYGALLLAGSVLTSRDDRRSLADFLIRVSARKVLWLVLSFVVSVAILDLLINRVFDSLGLQAQVPYFVGDSVIPLGIGFLSLKIPVTQGFTGVFIIAILVSVISLATSLYQGRVTLVKTDRGLRFRRMPEQPVPVPSPEKEEAVEITGTDR